MRRWLLVLLAVWLPPANRASAQAVVYRIDVTGTVENGLAPYVARSLAEAAEAGAAAGIPVRMPAWVPLGYSSTGIVATTEVAARITLNTAGLQAVLDALGLARPAVVGHSMGGSWTIMLAARHPELVGKAMVVDMMPYPGIMFRAQGMTEEQMAAQIDQMQNVLSTVPAEQRRMFTSMMISAMINTESEKQPNINASLASDQAVAAQGFTDLMRTNLLEEVGRIRAPLVVLYVQPAAQPGAPVITPEQIDRAYQLSYRAAPQAVIRRVPNSAHFIMFDNAPFFQAQLREFLTTPGTARPAQ